jgi:hypothetical protein
MISQMVMNEARYRPQTLHPLARWAAFTGIALLVVRRAARIAFPNLLPSNTWRPESWWIGVLIEGAFDLILLLLLAVPFCIYRSRHASVRDLLLDSAAAVSLCLAAVLLL